MEDIKNKGIGYLRNKLALKKIRICPRYEYYEMKFRVRDFGISTPPELMAFNSVLGWCGKTVDSLADRLIFREFRKDELDMMSIYQQNNPDVLFDSAILSALISSCCFIYISEDEKGFPRMQVIDGGHATGIIDPVTYLLKEGYAVLRTNENGNAVTEAYFTGDYTEIYERRKAVRRISNPTGHPLLVPIIFRPDAVRP